MVDSQLLRVLKLYFQILQGECFLNRVVAIVVALNINPFKRMIKSWIATRSVLFRISLIISDPQAVSFLVTIHTATSARSNQVHPNINHHSHHYNNELLPLRRHVRSRSGTYATNPWIHQVSCLHDHIHLLQVLIGTDSTCQILASTPLQKNASPHSTESKSNCSFIHLC